MNKNEARRRGLAARKNMSADVRNEKNRIIADIAVERVRNAACVGCYVTLHEEADTTAILRCCLDHGIRLCVPKVTGDTLTFYEISSLDDLQEGSFHVREPITDKVVLPEETDIMFVPLSAFDRYGHRTGYGRGYYDRILKRCSHTVGLAYSEQEIDIIETDPWDVDLDEVIYA